jgi:7-cyano-7-deazaguanine reductase
MGCKWSITATALKRGEIGHRSQGELAGMIASSFHREASTMSPNDEPRGIWFGHRTVPQVATLRTYPASESLLSDEIQFRFEGIGSLCPITGQPDTATILIGYVPEGLCLDEDSVWSYLCTFRNFPAFNEEVVNRILDDLVETAKPKRMTVIGRFATRGGISLTAEASFPD